MKQHRPLLIRFMTFVEVDQETKCWNWEGHCTPSKDSGNLYGSFSPNGKKLRASRWSYEYFRGQIPEDYQIHHTCRNTKCVNPFHLEALSAIDHAQTRIFIEREKIPKPIKEPKPPRTQCRKGHEYNEQNTIFKIGKSGNMNRVCRVCKRIADRESNLSNPDVKHGCFGRPKGSKDGYQRKRTGYIARYANKSQQEK